MKFQDKDIDKLEVTLPLAGGTELTCSVIDSFSIGSKNYFALQPLTSKKKPDPGQGPMLYRVEEDAEGNPVVVYIENDLEFTLAADVYAKRCH